MDVHEVSVADARRRLAEVLDAVEGGDHVRITRRGRGVARVMSERDYDLLVRGRPDVWVAIDGFRQRAGEGGAGEGGAGQGAGLVDDGWADDLRSTDPGRPRPFSS